MPRFEFLPKMGRFYEGNVSLKPGAIIQRARAGDLGHAVHKFKQLDPDEPNPIHGILSGAPRPTLRNAGKGLFDVLHPVTGQPINTKKLPLAEARAMIGTWTDDEGEGDDDGDPFAKGRTTTVPASTPGRSPNPIE